MHLAVEFVPFDGHTTLVAFACDEVLDLETAGEHCATMPAEHFGFTWDKAKATCEECRIRPCQTP